MTVIGNEIIINDYAIESYVELEGRLIVTYWKITNSITKELFRNKISTLDYAIYLAEK